LTYYSTQESGSISNGLNALYEFNKFDVSCPAGTVLSSFVLSQNNLNNNFYINFGCVTATISDCISNSKTNTGICNGNWNMSELILIYMDKHKIFVGANNALTRFSFQITLDQQGYCFMNLVYDYCKVIHCSSGCA